MDAQYILYIALTILVIVILYKIFKFICEAWKMVLIIMLGSLIIGVLLLNKYVEETWLYYTSDQCVMTENWPPEVAQWKSQIETESCAAGVPADMVAAIVFKESSGRSSVISQSGAVGLMQVMPRDGIAKTFICKNGPCFADRPSIEELKNPEFNIRSGINVFLSRFDGFNVRQTLKAYGPMDIDNYAEIIISIWKKYRINNAGVE
jgi:hypothetical protein